MAYKKQNFYTNQMLKAEHLNNIEDGIIANEAGYTYKFDFTTGNDLEYSIGIQWYNQTAKDKQESGGNIGTSNVYDPGWQVNGVEVIPPEKHNNSAIVGYRFTFKRNDGTKMKAGDITSVTISRKIAG